MCRCVKQNKQDVDMAGLEGWGQEGWGGEGWTAGDRKAGQGEAGEDRNWLGQKQT